MTDEGMSSDQYDVKRSDFKTLERKLLSLHPALKDLLHSDEIPRLDLRIHVVSQDPFESREKELVPKLNQLRADIDAELETYKTLKSTRISTALPKSAYQIPPYMLKAEDEHRATCMVLDKQAEDLNNEILKIRKKRKQLTHMNKGEDLDIESLRGEMEENRRTVMARARRLNKEIGTLKETADQLSKDVLRLTQALARQQTLVLQMRLQSTGTSAHLVRQYTSQYTAARPRAPK